MRKRSPCQSHGESHPSFVEAWMEKSLGGLCGNTLCAPQIQKLPSGACDGRIRNVESGGVWGGSGWRSCFLLGCLPQNAGDLHPRNTNMKPRNEGFKTMMFLFKEWSSGSILVFWGVPILKKNTSLLGCNNHRTQLKGCNDRKRRFRRIFKPTAAVFTTTSMTDFQVHPVGLLPRICIPGMRGSCAKDPPGETATKKLTYR